MIFLGNGKKGPKPCSVYGCMSNAQPITQLCKHHMAVRGLCEAQPSIPKKKRKPKLPKGKFGSGHGYVMVWVKPFFPGARPYGNTGAWAMMEHRKVMGEMIGRAVLPGETVHHINGIRHDNRTCNLELWVSSHPSGQRVKDQLEWARQIVARYDTMPEPVHNSHGQKEVLTQNLTR